MKKSLTVTALTLIAILWSGCQKNFLDRSPEGELTFEEFFQNSDQAVQATNAVYAQYRDFDMAALSFIGCTDILSDDSDKGSTANDAPLLDDLDNFTMDATNPFIAPIYKGHYRAIARANIAIEGIQGVAEMDEALRQRLIGECKFLRAYSYFLMVQWFGDLVLVTKTLQGDAYYAQTRQPKEAIYAQIEQDLKDAAAILPDRDGYPATEKGRATNAAAKGLLAKVYMVKKDWANAETTCAEIINSGKYSLQPRYADLFLQVGENGVESIFEIQAVALPTQQAAGPGSSPYNMVQGVRGIPNLGWGFNRPSDNLVSSYENGDPRREATVIYVGEILPDGSTQVKDNPEIINERYNQKAWVPAHPGLQDNGPGNIRVLRYADILLLAAEAKNELGKSSEALPLLNQVRKRARGTNNFILPDVTVTDQSQLRERIYKERRVELAMEQHRWFDLVRWGRAEQTMTALGKAFEAGKHELLPLPQTEVDLTSGKVAQNKGY
jgi:starch-binding outer membrane protein, SusD/RagB family